MLKKIYLTQEQQRTVDAYGLLKRHLPSDATNFYAPVPNYVQCDIQELLSKVRNIPRNGRPGYWSYWDEMAGKIGRQGGSFPLSTIEANYIDSYTLAERDVSFDLTVIGRDYLLQRLREVGPLAYRIEPTHYSTNAGSPTGVRKGTFDAETQGKALSWMHPWPNVPGCKRQRGKDRTINMDANVNVRYIEVELASVRHHLRSRLPEYFGAWSNPTYYVEPTLTNGLLNTGLRSAEFDYKAMDNHFSVEVVKEIVLPIYEYLLTEGEYWHFASFVEELFYQPIYMGSYLLTGKHNLLSGQAITQDFETIYTVCLGLGATLVLGVPYYGVAVGDDQTHFVPRGKLDAFADLVLQESERNGLTMSVDKCRFGEADVRFCRKVYETAGRKYYNRDGVMCISGAYPTSLAFNSIIYPQTLRPTAGVNFIAFLSICDNCSGSPDYNEFVPMMWRHLQLTAEFTTDDLLHYEAADWWSKVYGEQYNPCSSVTYRLLQQNNCIPRDK